jgi:integrase
LLVIGLPIADQTCNLNCNSGQAPAGDSMPHAPRFTERHIVAEAVPGRPLFVRDTPNLYLLTNTGKKRKQRWSFRFTDPDTGKVTTKTLGQFPAVSLAMAKNRADHARLILQRDNINPFKNPELNEGRTTFEEVAHEWINSRKFKNPKQRNSAERLLLVYPGEKLLKMQIIKIRPQHINDALLPRWEDSPGQVRRSLAMMKKVFARAKVKRLYFGENPALWEGVQEELFGPMPESDDKHFAAMPHRQVREFIRALRQHDSVAARALEFLILTATRSGETRGMKWSEVDLPNRLWIIPKERMKTGNREHRVPLSPPAIELLEQLPERSQYVFPGRNRKQPMEPKFMRRILRKMGISEDVATVHGFRSSFRDWEAERPEPNFEAAEMALAHSIGTKVTKAYLRSDLLDTRREIMDAWAKYIG